jgi:hypothetical protein
LFLRADSCCYRQRPALRRDQGACFPIVVTLGFFWHQRLLVTVLPPSRFFWIRWSSSASLFPCFLSAHRAFCRMWMIFRPILRKRSHISSAPTRTWSKVYFLSSRCLPFCCFNLFFWLCVSVTVLCILPCLVISLCDARFWLNVCSECPVSPSERDAPSCLDVFSLACV